MKTRGTLFLHGYGVRGGTWDRVRETLGTTTGPTAAPDLNASNIDELIALARGRARRLSLEVDGPILVVGHSLGGALAALVAQDPGMPVVGAAVLIAAPFGDRPDAPGPVLGFLLRHRLIPPAFLRPRFFSSATPLGIQKEVFANAVPEAPALRDLTTQRRFFHTDRFPAPLAVPSLVIASERDRIVPLAQSRAFAEILGSEVVTLPEEDDVGHDDFFAAPAVAQRIAGMIATFAERI